jgi:hypothetical protein
LSGRRYSIGSRLKAIKFPECLEGDRKLTVGDSHGVHEAARPLARVTRSATSVDIEGGMGTWWR